MLLLAPSDSTRKKIEGEKERKKMLRHCGRTFPTRMGPLPRSLPDSLPFFSFQATRASNYHGVLRGFSSCPAILRLAASPSTPTYSSYSSGQPCLSLSLSLSFNLPLISKRALCFSSKRRSSSGSSSSSRATGFDIVSPLIGLTGALW